MTIEIEIGSNEGDLIEKYKGFKISQCNQIPICKNTRVWDGEIKIGTPIKAKPTLKIKDEINDINIILYEVIS